MAVSIDLTGRPGLVTGGGAGIGRAIALTLARAGADVAVIDIDKAAAESAAEQIGSETGRRAVAVTADMTDAARCRDAVEEAAAALGGLAIAVNNVGMMGGHASKPFLDWTPQAMHDVINGNLMSAAYSCQAEAAVMVREGTRDGTIVNITSGETTRPAVRMAPYGAAKAGVNHLTTTLAIELAPYGIRVNSASPGTTLTREVEAALTPEYVSALGRAIPLGGALSAPQDLADLVLLLVSDLARHTTGQFVLSDNGAFLSRSRPALETNTPSTTGEPA